MNRVVRVEEAVGMTLAHDVTKVAPGFKGPAFKRGHVITEKDIPALLDIGKEHIYILTLEEGEVHEDEAAMRIAAALTGLGLKRTDVKEGRVDLVAAQKGLASINAEALYEINMLGDIIVATIHDGTVCKAGSPVAGMRIIPLCIADEKLRRLELIAARSAPVVRVDGFKLSRVGLIITGSEVAKGRIVDRFSPVLHKKVEALGCTVSNEAVVGDDSDLISKTISDFEAGGCEIILCTSGMSVDPDDVTPLGITGSGAKISFYGLPVLPGAMFMYGRLHNAHILGVPACVLHSPATGFDRLFPVLLTGRELTFEDTRKLGHGGMCLYCEQCHYPVCPFCK
jgi:hypothetical protein